MRFATKSRKQKSAIKTAAAHQKSPSRYQLIPARATVANPVSASGIPPKFM